MQTTPKTARFAVFIESGFSHKNRNQFCIRPRSFANVNNHNHNYSLYRRLVCHGEFHHITEVVSYLKF